MILQSYKKLIWLVLWATVTFAVIGCNSPRKTNKTVSDRCDALYESYLSGNVNEARQSLLETVQVIETTRLPKNEALAHGLWIAFARLAVLEFRTGNTLQGEAYLIEARYWYLKKCESNGKNRESLKNVVSFDKTKCVELVDGFDNVNTGGKGARYISALPR